MTDTGTSKWLDAETWAGVQQLVPIACVDLLALSSAAEPLIGLILRDTPHEGRRWCLIGGRILHNEPTATAIRRHVTQTLGASVRCELTHAQPLYVAEYFTDRRAHLVDPRQHAVALTYAGVVSGELQAAGEAYRFEWYRPSALPPRNAFGFGQDAVVDAVAAALAMPVVFGP